MTLEILIAVTHLLGAGHLTRAAAIGRALAAAGHRVTLVSGGMPAPLVPVDGLRIVQLPAVRSDGEDFSHLLDGEGAPVGPELHGVRSDMLAGIVAETRPDVVVTELYPFGRRVLAAEFDRLLDAAERPPQRPVVACSIRDVLVAPLKPDRIEATHATLRLRYDAVLVHGDPDLLPLDASWPVVPDLRGRLVYTGYVDGGPRVSTARDGLREGILVAGGSSAAALPLYRAALAAAHHLPDRHWRLLVGGGVAEPDLRELGRSCPTHVTVERARPDFRRLLAEADVFVGLAGYNTIMDLAATGVRAVLVPFERGRETEQRLRADALAARGYATLLPEAELDGPSLAAAVLAAQAGPRPPSWSIACDGASATVRLLEELATRRREEGRRRG